MNNNKQEEGVKKSFEHALQHLGENIFVSFDLDSIMGSDAPVKNKQT